MKIAQDINVDGITIVISEAKDGTQPKMNSVLQFTNRELQVPPAQIQQLLFRELLNSNRIMVCTGFQYGNEWYGDRPDDGVFKNPFDNKNVWIDEKPKIQPKITVQETWQGVQLTFTGVPNDKQEFATLNELSWNNQVFDSTLRGRIVNSEVENAIDVQFESANTVVSYANEFRLTFKVNGKQYTVLLPKVNDTSGLGAFEIAGESFFDLLAEISDTPEETIIKSDEE